jgi:soluble lytic murein transglycosylase-like protein
MMGAAYMKEQMNKYGDDMSLALAAYNAGPGAVDKYDGIPPYQETRDYVAKITKTYQKLKA